MQLLNRVGSLAAIGSLLKGRHEGTSLFAVVHLFRAEVRRNGDAI